MLIQVVHSHPLTDSYNHALFRIIVETLQARHQVIATAQISPQVAALRRRAGELGLKNLRVEKLDNVFILPGASPDAWAPGFSAESIPGPPTTPASARSMPTTTAAARHATSA